MKSAVQSTQANKPHGVQLGQRQTAIAQSVTSARCSVNHFLIEFPRRKPA
jgi:hypothetical protein